MHIWAYIGCLLIAVGYLLLLGFVQQRFRYLWRQLQPPHSGLPLPISVIVAAKNEAANLRKNLPQLLAQDYPDFEVLVVDDHSTDQTKQVIAAMHNGQLRYIPLPEGHTGKKAALAYAISQAANDWLVFTDADCWPASSHWLAAYGEAQQHANVILGYSPVGVAKGLLGKWVRYETWQTGLLYLSAAAAGAPYMAVGRNWGYTKKQFNAANGFRHTEVLSGDDDLFLQQIAPNAKVSVLRDTDSWMWTNAPASWHAWWRQKRRHLSAGWHYRPKDVLMLGLWTISHACQLAGIVLLLLTGHWYLAMLAIIIRGTTQIAIFGKSAQQLGELGLRPLILWLDLVYGIYIVLLVPVMALMRPTKWM